MDKTTPKNIVYLGKSLDGFIAGPNGELDWLDMVPNPDGEDMGYTALMNEIDALVMGRATFETVAGFGGEWPYTKPVVVLSHTLTEVPEALTDKVILLSGGVNEVLDACHQLGFYTLYIDGGKTVQDFLRADVIDELRITTLPIVLGEGIPMYGFLPHSLPFRHLKTEVFLGELVQSHYERKR